MRKRDQEGNVYIYRICMSVVYQCRASRARYREAPPHTHDIYTRHLHTLILCANSSARSLVAPLVDPKTTARGVCILYIYARILLANVSVCECVCARMNTQTPAQIAPVLFAHTHTLTLSVCVCVPAIACDCRPRPLAMPRRRC